ncbi:unnamed protein product, partial [Discosporangium mesarthrocarpum]
MELPEAHMMMSPNPKELILNAYPGLAAGNAAVFQGLVREGRLRHCRPVLPHPPHPFGSSSDYTEKEGAVPTPTALSLKTETKLRTRGSKSPVPDLVFEALPMENNGANAVRKGLGINPEAVPATSSQRRRTEIAADLLHRARASMSVEWKEAKKQRAIREPAWEPHTTLSSQGLEGLGKRGCSWEEAGDNGASLGRLPPGVHKGFLKNEAGDCQALAMSLGIDAPERGGSVQGISTPVSPGMVSADLSELG